MSPEQQTRVDSISRAAIALSPVKSSQIAAIGRDQATNTLAVQFTPRKERGEKEGPVYHYANVDAELFDRFQHADSLGSFFYKEIKPATDKYPYARVREAVVEQQAA